MANINIVECPPNCDRLKKGKCLDKMVTLSDGTCVTRTSLDGGIKTGGLSMADLEERDREHKRITGGFDLGSSNGFKS